MIVLPIEGYGLWSTLYGFLAVEADTTTVRGITYYQHGETPGLGGEVDNPAWRAAWIGRKAFDQDFEPAIQVIKGQAGRPEQDPHHVDGLTGATITSRGVTNMMRFWLGPDGFGPYLARFRETHAAPQQETTDGSTR
jgi:Na+-transporting NADH:ubiquinone oxidoreductase subunit C